MESLIVVALRGVLFRQNTPEERTTIVFIAGMFLDLPHVIIGIRRYNNLVTVVL